MTNPIFLHGLMVAALVSCVAPASGDVKKRKSALAVAQPAGCRVSEGRALLEVGRFDEALAMLRPLANGRAVDADVSRTQGGSELADKAKLDGVLPVIVELGVGSANLVRHRKLGTEAVEGEATVVRRRTQGPSPIFA